MLIGNKLFPYPLLNANHELSGYKESSSFCFSFDTDSSDKLIIKDEFIVLKNMKYILDDAGLEKYIDEGAIKGSVIVECSASTYRKAFDITSSPLDVKISAKDLHGTVIISCYLYAAKDISSFTSQGFSEEYSGYTFSIDKFDILAADDGFRFVLDVNEEGDDKVASIFSVVKSESNNNTLSYASNGKQIIITLPIEHYTYYEGIKTKSGFNNIAFALIAIPALSSCISDIANSEYESMEHIFENERWFKAVCKGYENVMHRPLTFEEINDVQFKPLEVAQIVLNHGICEGIKDFYALLMGSAENHEGSDDVE